MSELMIGASGVRGIVGRELTPERVLRLTFAFGLLAKGGKVVVGRDTRTSGTLMRQAALAGLLGSGCKVTDLGICPTPTVCYTTKRLRANGGLVITASHNPPEWNGLKFVSSKGLSFTTPEVERLVKRAEGVARTVASKALRGVRDYQGAVDRHIERIVSIPWLNLPLLHKRKFRVAIDCVNGAASRAAPSLLGRLGCKVFPINCSLNKPFPRRPEPVPENLTQLEEIVKNRKADIGFATDPDGDRLSVVSEAGLAIGEEYTLPLAAEFVLQKSPGPVVTNLSTSRMVDEVAARFGSKVYRAPVGEAWVVRVMERYGAVFGGEGNGGVILPRVHPTRDSLTGMALILGLMADRELTISRLVEQLPRFHMVKTKVPSRYWDLRRAMKSLKQHFPGAQFDTRDGIRVSAQESWVHLRPSRTEPVLRIIAEAPSLKKARELCRLVKETGRARQGEEL